MIDIQFLREVGRSCAFERTQGVLVFEDAVLDIVHELGALASCMSCYHLLV